MGIIWKSDVDGDHDLEYIDADFEYSISQTWVKLYTSAT